MRLNHLSLMALFSASMVLSTQRSAFGAISCQGDDQVSVWLETLQENAQKWKSGDCLIHVSRRFDSVNRAGREVDPNGFIQETETWYRLLFDYEKQLFAVLEHELVDETAGQQPRQRSERFRGACVNSAGTIFRRSFPKPLVEMPRAARELHPNGLFDDLQFPDFRGLMMFGDFPINAFERMEMYIRHKVDNWEVLNFAEGDESVRFELGNSNVSNEGIQAIDSWHFDTLRKVPIERSFQFRIPQASGVVETRDMGTTTAEWTEVNGVPLPTVFRRAAIQENGYNDKVRLQGDTKMTVKLHWFRFNEPLDETFFDGSKLDEVSGVLRATDPKQAGATSLLEE